MHNLALEGRDPNNLALEGPGTPRLGLALLHNLALEGWIAI